MTVRFKHIFIPLIALTYPLLVFFGLNHLSLSQLGGFLLCIALLRIISDRKTLKSSPTPLILAASLCIVAAYGMIKNSPEAFRYYPVLVNSSMLIIFGLSLFQSQTIIEKIARITEPELPQQAISYTRKVTIAWCLFFLSNGLIALWTTIVCDLKTWTLYNGFIAYLLMGLMFGLEWLIRQRVRNR